MRTTTSDGYERVTPHLGGARGSNPGVSDGAPASADADPETSEKAGWSKTMSSNWGAVKGATRRAGVVTGIVTLASVATAFVMAGCGEHQEAQALEAATTAVVATQPAQGNTTLGQRRRCGVERRQRRRRLRRVARRAAAGRRRRRRPAHAGLGRRRRRDHGAMALQDVEGGSSSPTDSARRSRWCTTPSSGVARARTACRSSRAASGSRSR